MIGIQRWVLPIDLAENLLFLPRNAMIIVDVSQVLQTSCYITQEDVHNPAVCRPASTSS